MSILTRLLGSGSDSYGHVSGSGYGKSDYGSYGSYDVYGAHSGHGHDCCPLVVDPLTWFALLAFIAAAAYFLEVAVQMSMLGRRKKRSIFLESKYFSAKIQNDIE